MRIVVEILVRAFINRPPTILIKMRKLLHESERVGRASDLFNLFAVVISCYCVWFNYDAHSWIRDAQSYSTCVRANVHVNRHFARNSRRFHPLRVHFALNSALNVETGNLKGLSWTHGAGRSYGRFQNFKMNKIKGCLILDMIQRSHTSMAFGGIWYAYYN